MTQDSSLAQFWDTRYRGGVTPWDAAGVPKRLIEYLETLTPGRVLVPGCGAGYEVKAFSEHRHDVLAIEFSDAAIEAAQRQLGPFSGRVKKADFFSFDTTPFDLVYERAFLCALPPVRHFAAAVGRTAFAVVRSGGKPGDPAKPVHPDVQRQGGLAGLEAAAMIPAQC